MSLFVYTERACACLCVCKLVHVCVRERVRMCVCICVCERVHMRVCVYGRDEYFLFPVGKDKGSMFKVILKLIAP